MLMSYGTNELGETWEFAQASRTRSIRAGTHIIANNGDFLYALAKSGQGMCALPDFITDAGRASGAVVEVLPHWTLTSLWLTLFYPPYEQLPPVVGTFADYFEAFILAHPNLSNAPHPQI